MSDSECESAFDESRVSKSERRKPTHNSRSDSEDDIIPRRNKAKALKRKSTQVLSDSEDGHPTSRDRGKTSKKKSTTARTPSKTSVAKRQTTEPEEDLFGLVFQDEKEAAHASASRRAAAHGGGGGQLSSSFCSKVADGAVLRRAQLSGRYYAELRLYATRDALDARPDTRYTKALVTLKLQLDPDQPEWDLLQKFLKKAKTAYFANSAPVFYNNNKSY